MKFKDNLTRRDFLKFAGVNLAALALPGVHLPGGEGFPINIVKWPKISEDQLPSRVVDILSRVPTTLIDSHGFLNLLDAQNFSLGTVPLTPTLWNIENSQVVDRLYSHIPWGIVLHWYGDRENFDGTVKSYLRGFDSLRQIDNYVTRTSAHFLVGSGDPGIDQKQGQGIFVLQTQAPASDGTPFVASHLQPLNYQNHLEKKQYFVRALYQMGYDGIGVHSLLQDLFDGPKLDPNMRTIAIEIAGYDFENPAHYPDDQKIANAVSVVCAIMKRYGIPASNLMGHNEIQLGKADPGKKFMALIRYLIGVKALVDKDTVMKRLVFGQFMEQTEGVDQAICRYFEAVHKYLVYVGSRRRVFEWEAESKYWFVHDLLSNGERADKLTSEFCWPFGGGISTPGYTFLQPNNHEGVDLYSGLVNHLQKTTIEKTIQLIAAGKCVFLGRANGRCGGKIAIFRHRQSDGSEIATVYDHLEKFADIQVGQNYSPGQPIGVVENHAAHQNAFLHFSVAYGATWEMDLSRNPDKPLNAGESWIKERYLNPLEYLHKQLELGSGELLPTPKDFYSRPPQPL
jgi:murein DD-endopeptidase MepM/ murein hydrolase activator NlpD